jgi:CrcB protein
MEKWIFIAVGAILGAWSRAYAAQWAAVRFQGDFPWGTFLINLSGSFILGLFLTMHLERGWFPPQARYLVAVGWCASFTTFSTFSYETFKLFSAGQEWLAVGNVFLSVTVVFGGDLGPESPRVDCSR